MKSSYIIAFAMTAAAAAWILSGQLPDGAGAGDPATATHNGAERAMATAALPQVRVRVSTARPRTREIVIRGRTAASRKVALRVETSGRIAEIAVERGARVRKGQVIARLGMDDRAARLAEAKAILDQRRIEYRAATALAKKGYRAETKLAESRANLEAAKAAVARIEVDIAHTAIRAPFDGILDERPVEIGDFVDVGDHAATVVDLDPLLVVGEVSERDIEKVKPGRTGRARTVTGEELEGKLRYVASVADAATRTFRVEMEVPNPLERPGGPLVEGVSTELRLPIAEIPAHLLSPAILTLSDSGEIGIKSIGADNIVRFRPVRIIADTPEGIWLSGLPEKITVITVGQEFVRAGDRAVPVFVPEDVPDGKGGGPGGAPPDLVGGGL